MRSPELVRGAGEDRRSHPLDALRSSLRPVVRSGIERSVLAGSYFWRVPEPVRGVALTFDDGPDPRRTPQLLDLLGEHGARATFFVLGERALRYPDVVRRMVAEGHVVGNHSFTHVRCPRVSDSVFRSELRYTDAVLRMLNPGVRFPLFRPPYGALRPRRALRLARAGRRIALWNVDSFDYAASSLAELDALAAALEPRDILLMHDRFSTTLAALPRLLRELRRRELETVPLHGPYLTAVAGGPS